jgi:hypothetical protein
VRAKINNNRKQKKNKKKTEKADSCFQHVRDHQKKDGLDIIVIPGTSGRKRRRLLCDSTTGALKHGTQSAPGAENWWLLAGVGDLFPTGHSTHVDNSWGVIEKLQAQNTDIDMKCMLWLMEIESLNSYKFYDHHREDHERNTVGRLGATKQMLESLDWSMAFASVMCSTRHLAGRNGQDTSEPHLFGPFFGCLPAAKGSQYSFYSLLASQNLATTMSM